MGKRTGYAPGTFCWVDLAARDLKGAEKFYGGLLGWTFDERRVDGSIYAMARRYDADVAAVSEQRPAEQAAGPAGRSVGEGGSPPHWNSYVSTESADQIAARATELGGSMLVEPFDVQEAGRMTVIADPTGAVLCAWQAGDHAGAGHVNDPGCLTWNDLVTTDAGRATSFYSALFGWRFVPVDTGGGPAYWTIVHDGASEGRNGGMRELTPEQMRAQVPSNWTPYFTVESLDVTLDAAKASGGRVLFGPNAVPAGRFAILADPQGAAFAIFEGEVDQ